MPSLHTFEGPDLEALLEDIQDRFGAEVSIAEANRVRRGGVAGFFSREVYEVTVEVDDDQRSSVAAPVTSARSRTATPAASVLDLLDAVEDRHDAEGAAPPETVAELVRRRGGAGVDDLFEAAGRRPPRQTPSATHAPPARTTTAAALFAPDRRSTIIEEDPAPMRLSTDGPGFADVLERIARQTAAPAPASDPHAPFEAFGAPAPTITPAVPRPRQTRGNQPAAPDGLNRAALEGLGVPADLVVAELPDRDRLTALLALATYFPTAAPLPATGDNVIVLVGDRGGLMDAAAHVNELLGLNPERVVVATRRPSAKIPMHRRIETVDEAASQRRHWRRRTAPTLVMVDEAVSRANTGWARHVLDALEPSATWGIVNAQRKPEDLLDWIDRLGGVDALGVFGTDETTSPASVLAAGVPVALLDSRPATAARWAALLDDRLQGKA